MRSRNIKPNLFKNEILGVADPILTVVFAGLWCAADREGRIEDRPLRLKAEILPYRENIDFNVYLTELASLEFICRYRVENIAVIQILNFKKHQNPHKTEKQSELPAMPETQAETGSCSTTVKAPLNNGSRPADSLIPDSLNTDSCIGEKEESAPKKMRLVKPSLEEVFNYCQERGKGVDAEAWMNHYTSNGWMVGKTKMVDWKAAVRTWERNAVAKQSSSSHKRTKPMTARERDALELIGRA